MGESWYGDARYQPFKGQYNGVYTERVSACSVISIAEFKGGNWCRFFFYHAPTTSAAASIGPATERASYPLRLPIVDPPRSALDGQQPITA